MNLNKNKTSIFCLNLFLLSLLFVVSINGQSTKKDVFASVNDSQREQLISRLNLIVENQASQNWSNLYDLLSVTFLQEDDRQEFIDRQKKWYSKGLGTNLLTFIPTSITVHDDSIENGWITIGGCSKITDKGKETKIYTGLEARRENNDWYFSLINPITSVGGKARPCPCP